MNNLTPTAMYFEGIAYAGPSVKSSSAPYMLGDFMPYDPDDGLPTEEQYWGWTTKNKYMVRNKPDTYAANAFLFIVKNEQQ